MKHLYLKKIDKKIQGAAVNRNAFREALKSVDLSAAFKKDQKKKAHNKGVSNDVDAPTLDPPKYGELDMIASNSFMEIVDILCDGPIAGIVCNKNGSAKNESGIVMNGAGILKGIYFDSTPIVID